MGGGGMRRRGAACELCGEAAAVHCEADAAFLCAACDGKVHGANFLASRHRRWRVAAAEEEVGCESGASAASSLCVSTADSAPASRRRGKPKGRARGDAVLEGWARRMGLPAGVARRRAAAAGRALRSFGRDVAAARVPLRVAMAAALWWEVATDRAIACAGDGYGDGQADTLRRLEACAHVPARHVMTVASSMGRARARRRAAKEGWDECS